MKSKKTIQLQSGLFIAIICFMMTWQASAQTFGVNQTGNYFDGWIINQESSNHWSRLRFQSYINMAWSLVNEEDFWWGYATNNDYNDRGVEKMRLTTDGDLIISGNASVARTLTTGVLSGSSPAYINWNNTRGMILSNGSDNAFFGLVNRNGENGNYDHFNTVIYFGDEVDDDLEFQSQDHGELMRLTGDGLLGLGTSYPVSLFHLHQTTNDNSGGIKIENSGQGRQFNLYVDGNNDSRINSGNTGSGELILNSGGGKVGIGTTTPRGKLDVDGSGDIYLVDDPNNSGSQSVYIPGHIYIAPHGSGTSYIQARRKDNSGSTNMRFRTYNNGQLTDAMQINSEGKVGIGTVSPTEKLHVSGTVKATSFVSSTNSFPDYVFAEDYKIMPLSELEAYVKQHHRLPNMPSEKEVVQEGLNMPEVMIRSVENIETIYLHLIRMEKKIEALEQENASLKQQLKQRR